MKHLSRDGYIAEGGRLLRRLQRLETAGNRAAYVAWLAKARPTRGELQTVLRLARAGRKS